MAAEQSVTGGTDPTAGQEAGPRDRIRLVVAAIPAGRVTTYGDVAAFAGLPRRARLVGRVLADLPAGNRLPWHRVIRGDGRIAARGGGEREQAARLRAEGVVVYRGRIDLRRHRWQP